MTCLLPLAAHAVTLEEAKAQGLVGEDASGYLAAVSSKPDRDVRALVADVNAKRRAEYERIAEDNGIDVADVEALAGRKAIDKTAPGLYIRLPGEDWRKK
jgi:uncharacterized protein YdbL (DUF1318 family)